jgi:hypothetical protein
MLSKLPISSSARQHLVDADHMERMQAHSDVELVLAAVLDEVLVAANAASLKGLGGQLFILVGHEMHAEGEVLDMSLLPAQIVNSDLGVGDTTTEPTLGVGFVLAVAVTED